MDNDTFLSQLTAARAGDKSVLGELLHRSAPELRRAVSADLPRRWRHLLSVDDVFQQTCVDVFGKISAFTGNTESTLHAWLLRIAKRNLLDAVRMLETEKRGGSRKEVDSQQASVDLLLALGGGTTPSLAVSRQEAADALRTAITSLPAPYRQVLEEYDLGGRDMAEVGTALGRSRGAAYMLRARALRLIRERLGETGQFFSTGA